MPTKTIAAIVTAVALPVVVVLAVTQRKPVSSPVTAGTATAAPAAAAFPTPPPGSVVFARAAGHDGVGLAVLPPRRRNGSLALQVSVIDRNGQGLAGLRVGLRLEGGRGPARTFAAAPCGPGCYRASAPPAARPARVVVTLARHVPHRIAFAIPRAWPPRPATALVARAGDALRSLRTLVFHDTLSSGLGHTVRTTWKVVAPDRISYDIAGGGSAVIIGNRRWDRTSPGAPWQESEQNPALHQPVPFWRGAADAHVVGETATRGHKAWRISFFDPGTPGWYELVVERSSYRLLEMRMVAASHFMHQVYGPFNAHISIDPPR